MSELVFLPLSGDELRGWAASGVLPGPRIGYAVTPAMTAAFGVSDPEEADHAALSIASIAGLAGYGLRLIAVVNAEFPAGADEFGAVELGGLAFHQVTALFGEDPDPSLATAAAAAVQGMPLDQAWETPAVAELLAERDLLWYGPSEWQLLS